MKNTKLAAAVKILNGETMVSRDRKAADAPKIDHTVVRTKIGTVVVPYYGLSYTMHNAIAKLAKDVLVVQGHYEYVF